MAQQAATQAGERARAEAARSPRIPLSPDARLRSWLARDYEGFVARGQEAWDLLVRTAGRSTIREIAREVGWSHKHLITKFKQQVGVAPRMAARLVRLSMVWRHIDDERSWARIAAGSLRDS